MPKKAEIPTFPNEQLTMIFGRTNYYIFLFETDGMEA